MIALRAELKVVVASQPIDFRRGVNGLAALVVEALAADPIAATSSSSDRSGRTG